MYIHSGNRLILSGCIPKCSTYISIYIKYIYLSIYLIYILMYNYIYLIYVLMYNYIYIYGIYLGITTRQYETIPDIYI